MERTLEIEAYENVWDAIMDTPAEAAYMTMCSKLLIAIEERVEAWGVSEDETARRLDISADRLRRLLTGDVNAFSLDDLVRLAVKAGLSLNLEVREAA